MTCPDCQNTGIIMYKNKKGEEFAVWCGECEAWKRLEAEGGMNVLCSKSTLIEMGYEINENTR